MHSGHQELQCLICHQPILKSELLISYIEPVQVCSDCLRKFHVLSKKEKVANKKVWILYEYNAFFRELLYRYKANYDLELKSIFLVPFILELKRKYHHFVVIPAPSSKQSNEKRGFQPMYEIAKELGLEVLDCLYKVDEYKQSDQKFMHRKEVRNHIQIKEVDLSNLNILWIDDVTTSYHTLLTCIDLIESKHPKKVEVLLLAKRIKKE